MKRDCVMIAAVQIAAVVVFGIGAVQAEPPAGSEPNFIRDVVPVLTKAGCNGGACHGAFSGRGGFRLSLLGGNAAADY